MSRTPRVDAGGSAGRSCRTCLPPSRPANCRSVLAVGCDRPRYPGHPGKAPSLPGKVPSARSGRRVPRVGCDRASSYRPSEGDGLGASPRRNCRQAAGRSDGSTRTRRLRPGSETARHYPHPFLTPRTAGQSRRHPDTRAPPGGVRLSAERSIGTDRRLPAARAPVAGTGDQARPAGRRLLEYQPTASGRSRAREGAVPRRPPRRTTAGTERTDLRLRARRPREAEGPEGEGIALAGVSPPG